MANAKPCAECSRWLRLATHVGVDYQIFYTNDDQQIQNYQYDCKTYLPSNTYF